MRNNVIHYKYLLQSNLFGLDLHEVGYWNFFTLRLITVEQRKKSNLDFYRSTVCQRDLCIVQRLQITSTCQSYKFLFFNQRFVVESINFKTKLLQIIVHDYLSYPLRYLTIYQRCKCICKYFCTYPIIRSGEKRKRNIKN